MKKEPSIKIFVTYKEKHKVLKSDIITPIQTGRAIADEVFEGMIGDDTGDNISVENPKYNELSAQYWVWKNYDKIGNPDYVGFMHYRRHFLFNDKKKRPDSRWLPDSDWYLFERINDDYMHYLADTYIYKAVDGCDCIVPKPYDYANYMFKNLIEDYKNLYCQKIEHFHLMLDTVKTFFPEYSETVEEIRNGSIKYIANMFVMSKKMFFEYCHFLFSIEEKVNDKIDSSLYNRYEVRFLGFLGEILLTLFILQKKKEKKYLIKEIDTSFVRNTEEDVLVPKFENGVVLCASSSNEYAPYLSVYLQSIIENSNKNNNYDIIIFERSITQENKDKLLAQISKYNNLSLRFVNPTPYLKNYDLKYPPHYNLECFFRLTAPLVLKNYKKVIFTDIDMIVLKDLKELYDVDVESYPLAACKDLIWSSFLNNIHADWREYAINKLKLNKPFEYYNTGVMVLNIAEFNKNNYSEKVLKLANEENYRILEQDGLNAFFQTNIKYIDTAWNFPIANICYKAFLPLMPYSFFEQYKKDRENPKIIHYAGGLKPWYYPDEDMAHIWWEYARKTPFYEEILQRLVLSSVSGGNGQVLGYHPQKEVVKLFNVISLFKKKSGINKVKYYFFGMPVFKKKIAVDKIKYYFFGVPVWKTRIKGNIKKGYLFGFIPLLQCIKK